MGRRIKAKKKLRVLDRPRPRRCGGCTECCTTLEVREAGVKVPDGGDAYRDGVGYEFHTPKWTKCEHECAKGCAIYETRPEACANFICSWLEGVPGVDIRPDALGAVIYNEVTNALGYSFMFHESRVGASQTDEAQALIRGLVMEYEVPVIVHGRDESGQEFRTVYGDAKACAIARSEKAKTITAVEVPHA